MATKIETFIAEMETKLNKTAILTFAKGYDIWQKGSKRQIVDIRDAFLHGTEHELAAMLTIKVAAGTCSNKQVRSYNSATGRECVLDHTKNKGDTTKQPKWPQYRNNKHGFKLDSKTGIVAFGPSGEADNKKAKCPMLSAIAKLKAEKKDTPEAVKTIVTLIESYINAQ